MRTIKRFREGERIPEGAIFLKSQREDAFSRALDDHRSTPEFCNKYYGYLKGEQIRLVFYYEIETGDKAAADPIDELYLKR